MSQQSLKSQRRYIRRIQRQSYESTIASLAAGEARSRALQSFMKAKPKWLPAFVWGKLQNIVLKLPQQ